MRVRETAASLIDAELPVVSQRSAMNDVQVKSLATNQVPELLHRRDAVPVVYGIPVSEFYLMHQSDLVAEILEPQEVASIPNTVSWFAGMINVRGALAPVFDLTVLLSGRAAGTRRERRRLMVIGEGDDAGALYIDSLPQRMEIDMLVESDGESLPEIFDVAKIRTYRSGRTVWVELDYMKLFSLLGESVLEKRA